MNAVCIAALMLGGSFLLWAATFGVRALLKDFSTPLKQPEDSPVPPTGTLRPQHRVAPSDPNLSATLSSLQEAS